MPTENRSTLRDLFIRLNPGGLDASELVTDSLSFAEPATAQEFHLFCAGYEAAQQHQSEPVAWRYVEPGDEFNGYQQRVRLTTEKPNAVRARLGCEPLYTRPAPADSAEVDRLRAVIWQQKNLIQSLRAELVESYSIDASAEPSAPKCETCHDSGHVPEPMLCKGSLACPTCAPAEIGELVSEDELREMASIACQSALAHGVSEDWFMQLARSVEQRARAALERKQ